MSPRKKTTPHYTDLRLGSSQRALISVTVFDHHTQKYRSCGVGRPADDRLCFSDEEKVSPVG